MKRLLITASLILVSTGAIAEVCSISEFTALPIDTNGNVIYAPPFPPLTTQSESFTSTSEPSAAFNANTHYILVMCDGKSHFRVGPATPTAVTTDPWIPAETWIFIEVRPGHIIAFIENA